MIFFWKKDHVELDKLRRQVADNERAREAARLNLQLSALRLARFLEEIPLDDSIAAIGEDLAGNPERKE